MKAQRSAPAGGSRRRRDPFAQPLDRALERLRVQGLGYRADDVRLDQWTATCPACRAWGALLVRELYDGGPVELVCGYGCPEAQIAAVLRDAPARVAVEVAEERARDALDLATECCALAARALDRLAATVEPVEVVT